VRIAPILLISGFRPFELTVDRLLMVTVLFLNEQSLVLAFMNANSLRETYILS
jgi:hypothetical protein